MVSSAERPRVLNLTPGRVRLHLPGWAAGDVDRVETRLSRVKGVQSIQANPLTGNVLVRFDRRATGESTLLAALHRAWGELLAAQQREEGTGSEAPARDGTVQPAEDRGPPRPSLIRAGVRGLLGHAVVDSLWFAAGFLGQSLGLPLAGLGPLHLVTDVVVWGWALGSGVALSRPPATRAQAQQAPHRPENRGVPRLPEGMACAAGG